MWQCGCWWSECNEATIALHRQQINSTQTLYDTTSCLQWQTADLYYANLLSAVIYMQKKKQRSAAED